VPVSVSWPTALSWRLERQLLDPVRQVAVDEVVRRLGGVQAQVQSSADLGIRVRRASSEVGDVDRALADGRVIKDLADAWLAPLDHAR
jgi:hypothetical protein